MVVKKNNLDEYEHDNPSECSQEPSIGGGEVARPAFRISRRNLASSAATCLFKVSLLSSIVINSLLCDFTRLISPFSAFMDLLL